MDKHAFRIVGGVFVVIAVLLIGLTVFSNDVSSLGGKCVDRNVCLPGTSDTAFGHQYAGCQMSGGYGNCAVGTSCVQLDNAILCVPK